MQTYTGGTQNNKQGGEMLKKQIRGKICFYQKALILLEVRRNL